MITTNQIYRNLLHEVLLRGQHFSPRSIGCKEIICWTSQIDMAHPYVTIPARKIGNKFRYAEAAWILSGDNRVSTITPYAKKLGEYSDDGHYFAGAYGPPFRDQLPYVLYCLRRDSSTRQAVISIWRPRPYESKDIPCTISLQFLLRDNYLNVVATMRSSDAWLGWPYDVHTFSCIGAYIALHLDCELGFLSLTAGSQHLYDTDLDKAKRLLKAAETSPHMEFEWKGMKPDEFIESLWEQARS